MKLAPDDLVLATDYAESYYGIKPLRTNDALAGVDKLPEHLPRTKTNAKACMLHLARVKIAAGFYDEAQAHLDAVTNRAFRRHEKTARAQPRTTTKIRRPIPSPETATEPVQRPQSIRRLDERRAGADQSAAAFAADVAVMTNVPPAVPKLPNLQVAPPPLRAQKPQ